VLHAISLASTAVTAVRARAIRRRLARLRQGAEVERPRNEIMLLREELYIKDARMVSLPAPRRPRYRAVHGMAILELRAQCGWSFTETGRRFLVEPRTVAA
jgi:hypothetical protein